MIRNRRLQKGFTLIELMIVVAIAGILASVALQAYQTYLRNANMAKVSTHYDEAVRYIQNEMRRIQASVSNGTLSAAAADAAMAEASVIGRLNQSGGVAPGGVPAYSDTANDAAGVITVDLTAGLVSTADIVFTVTRPAYADTPPDTSVINWADI